MLSIFQVAALFAVQATLALASIVEYGFHHSTEVAWAIICSYLTYRAIVYVWRYKIRNHPATKQTYYTIVKLFRLDSGFSEDPVEQVEILGSKDIDLVSDSPRENTKRVRSNRRVPYAVRVSLVAKAEVGLLPRGRASELVYAKLCRTEMIKHGVRPSHIAHIVPIAVAACFVPLDSDFLAASILRCKPLQESRARLGPEVNK